MSEIDLVGMANAILRQRDRMNTLMQENLRVTTLNVELQRALDAANKRITELTLRLHDAHDFAIEVQERSGA
jgi:hypothetical protein